MVGLPSPLDELERRLAGVPGGCIPPEEDPPPQAIAFVAWLVKAGAFDLCDDPDCLGCPRVRSLLRRYIADERGA